VDLADDPMRGRGEISFGKHEKEWNLWFKNYKKFISHYANLAAELNVEYFVIGTELEGASRRESNWRSLIKTVRKRYHGSMTYAANTKGEDENIRWWDAVDSIGIIPNDRLEKQQNPTLRELYESWRLVASGLESLSLKWNKKILITQVGFKTEDLNMEKQARSYEAVFLALKGKPWLLGIYWWNWKANSLQGGPNDKDFAALGKSAESVLRKYFGGATIE
jgi:hypothetical protein